MKKLKLDQQTLRNLTTGGPKFYSEIVTCGNAASCWVVS